MNAASPDSVRVLVCDDDAALSSAVATLIDYTPGMELVGPAVFSGQDAIAAVRLHHPDVVLMDVDLIGLMDGFEATTIIRAEAPSTHVVIISGMPDVARGCADARAAGAHDFLPKVELADRMIEMIRWAADPGASPAGPW